MSDLSRRRFLGAAAGLTAAAAASPLLAIPPIERTGRRRMRLGLAAYSLRDDLPRYSRGKTESKMDLFGFVDFASTLDLDAVELTAYFFPEPAEDEWLYRLKRHCHVTIELGAPSEQ